MDTSISLEQARLYEKYRLPYARQAAEELMEIVGDLHIIADIGAGTGQLSRLFTDKCRRIYAVEPDPAMRKVATNSLSDCQSIEILAGMAERLPIMESSVDLVVIGNAFHRFKPEACHELRRILIKGGWIAIFGYEFNNDEFNDMMKVKLATLKEFSKRVERSSHGVNLQDIFGGTRLHRLSHSQRHEEDWPAYWGAARSRIEAPGEDDPEYKHYEEIHREIFDAFVDKGRIQIEYSTEVVLGQPFI